MGVPAAAERQTVALLGPMSGLAAQEDRLTEGAIKVRLGEGRTAEVLRNLCYQVYEDESGSDRWQNIAVRLQELFGVHLNPPRFIAERGELTLTYRDRNGIELDISCAGRGQQQTLLLLAHMAANPGTTLLLDEPDAHLEILRQRQIYQVLTDIAGDTGCQILAASHSEVMLNEAAGRDTVLAFAAAQGGETSGPLFSNLWADAMARAIDDIEAALATLGEPAPWGPDIKASDGFLDRLFPKFYRALGLENLLNKTNYHVPAPYVGTDSLDPEIAAKLDLISETACRARPRGGEAT